MGLENCHHPKPETTTPRRRDGSISPLPSIQFWKERDPNKPPTSREVKRVQQADSQALAQRNPSLSPEELLERVTI